MAAGQVVLYFDSQEDALQFTLAASSVISGGHSTPFSQELVKIAREISKVNRITTEGVKDSSSPE